MRQRKIFTTTQKRLYKVWSGMIQRCNNKNQPHYKYYGGRGIKVCKEWLLFDNFYSDMFPTYKEGLELDRINNDEGYCKENTRWASHQQNCKNRRQGGGRTSNSWTEEEKNRLISRFAKTYKITKPNGEIEIIKNLSKYCRDNNFCLMAVHSAINKQKTYKKYKVERI